MKKIPLLSILALLITVGMIPAQAQQPQQGQIPVWRCELPGGVFIVDPVTISSVSSHEYIVDGVARVTELTIATTGAIVARFYYLEPLKVKSPVDVGQSLIDKVDEKIQEGTARLEQAGVEPIWKKVIKNYPLSTHAHTVEYRVESKEQLDKILKSVENAWRHRQNITLKISGTH